MATMSWPGWRHYEQARRRTTRAGPRSSVSRISTCPVCIGLARTGTGDPGDDSVGWTCRSGSLPAMERPEKVCVDVLSLFLPSCLASSGLHSVRGLPVQLLRLVRPGPRALPWPRGNLAAIWSITTDGLTTPAPVHLGWQLPPLGRRLEAGPDDRRQGLPRRRVAVLQHVDHDPEPARSRLSSQRVPAVHAAGKGQVHRRGGV